MSPRDRAQRKGRHRVLNNAPVVYWEHPGHFLILHKRWDSAHKPKSFKAYLPDTKASQLTRKLPPVFCGLSVFVSHKMVVEIEFFLIKSPNLNFCCTKPTFAVFNPQNLSFWWVNIVFFLSRVFPTFFHHFRIFSLGFPVVFFRVLLFRPPLLRRTRSCAAAWSFPLRSAAALPAWRAWNRGDGDYPMDRFQISH